MNRKLSIQLSIASGSRLMVTIHIHLTLMRFEKKTYIFGLVVSVRTPLVFFKEIVIIYYSKVLFWL